MVSPHQGIGFGSGSGNKPATLVWQNASPRTRSVAASPRCCSKAARTSRSLLNYSGMVFFLPHKSILGSLSPIWRGSTIRAIHGATLMRDDIHEFLLHRQSLGRSPETMRGHVISLRQFKSFCESKKVKQTRDLTPSVIKRFHSALIKQNLAKGTIANKLDAVRLFLRWAFNQNKTLANLEEHATRPKLGSHIPPSPLTKAEMHTVLNLLPAKGIVNMRDRAILEMLYATGLRNKELQNLNVGDVDFKAETLFIRGKGQRDRIVPVHDEALKVLGEYLQARGTKPGKQEPLFIVHERAEKHRITRNNIENLFIKVNRRFDKKRIYPHLIRHTCAIHMLQGGADLRYVQALLGHESPDTTSVYLHFARSELKRAYDRAVEAFWSG